MDTHVASINYCVLVYGQNLNTHTHTHILVKGPKRGVLLTAFKMGRWFILRILQYK